MFRIDCHRAWISSSLVLYQVPRSGSFTLVKKSQSHGLISGEYGNVPEFPTASGTRGQWQQQCDSLHCHEEWWGSVPPSVIVFYWVHVITISLTKWKNHYEGPDTTQEMNLSVLGQSMREINKNGRADSVRRLPNVWKNVINMGATILKVHKWCSLLNKAISEISNCFYYFYPTVAYNKIL